MLNVLVAKMVIHERDVSEMEWRQKIEIYYNFVGNLDEGEHMLYDGWYSVYKNRVRDEKGRWTGKEAEAYQAKTAALS